MEKISRNYLNEQENQPVTDNDNSEEIYKVAKLPLTPIIGPKLREVFKKKNINTIFRSGSNLKSLLWQNQTKLLPNSYSGVY